MLCLSRKKDEQIVARSADGTKILTLIIVAISGDRVRLGFEASNDVAIHRAEIDAQLQAAGKTQIESRRP